MKSDYVILGFCHSKTSKAQHVGLIWGRIVSGINCGSIEHFCQSGTAFFGTEIAGGWGLPWINKQ